MRKTLSLGLLAVLTLSGRPLAAPARYRRSAGFERLGHVGDVVNQRHIHDASLHGVDENAESRRRDRDGCRYQGLLQPGALQGFELQIPVNTFTSDKDGLTKQMFKAMKADKHPTITFRLDSYTVEAAAGGVTVKPTGTLTVAGVEQPIDMVLDVKEVAGALQVRGTRDLLMTDFGIKPPTMFMGMLKTDDKVTIKFELQLALAAKASN